jgi:choline-sulfatase
VINRRQFLETAIASTAAATAGCSPAEQASANRPNVISISVDDMNDWVGCLQGYPGVHTPNIDALAKRGVLFNDAHCTSPICNPSRTSISSGSRYCPTR